MADFEGKIEFSRKCMPKEPVGFEATVGGAKCINYYSGQYEHYEKRYLIWKSEHIEALNYCAELQSLDYDLNFISQTIEKYMISQDTENFGQTSVITTVLGLGAPDGKKPKRVNKVAKERTRRVLEKYDDYIWKKYTYESALQRLIHDFNNEYCPDNPVNRRKVIQSIIRNREKLG